MSVQTEETLSVSPAAPLEPNISQSPFVNRKVILYGDKAVMKEDTVWNFVKDDLPHVGRVDLVNISVSYKCAKSGSKVSVGMCAHGLSTPAWVLALQGNGISFTANDFTSGQDHVSTIVPLSITSRQLQPASSMLPTTELKVDISDGVEYSLIFDLHIYDVVISYRSLKA